MATIDNYSFICVENERMRFARPNENHYCRNTMRKSK